MTMSEWLDVNPKEFSKPEQLRIRGVNVDVFLSPYDMPEAVRGTYDKNEQKFTIEFRYIGGDEPLERDVQDKTTISVGKRSKRIYKIELTQVELTNKMSVGLRLMLPKVDAALDRLEHDYASAQRSGNYQIAKKILEKRGETIFARQVAA